MKRGQHALELMSFHLCLSGSNDRASEVGKRETSFCYNYQTFLTYGPYLWSLLMRLISLYPVE